MNTQLLHDQSVVFCDSAEALSWAYNNGLSKEAQIRSCAPAVLALDNPSVVHQESRWSIDELKRFQGSIQTFSIDIYDASRQVEDISREDAVAISLVAVLFQRLLFKAACLTEQDCTEKRLFLSVEGFGGHAGNNMNAPWGWLLADNQHFNEVTYTLPEKQWQGLSTQGISLFKRLKLAGFDVLLVRLMVRFWRKMPRWMKKRQVFIPRENELVLDIASYLAKRGIALTEIRPTGTATESTRELKPLLNAIEPIIRQRLTDWVVPSLIEKCYGNIVGEISKQLASIDMWQERWTKTITEQHNQASVILMNAPGNVMGLGLFHVAKQFNIPMTSVQHGVSKEICSTLGENVIGDEVNASDVYFTYNDSAAQYSQQNYFAYGQAEAVGFSSRQLRVSALGKVADNSDPILYISTNIYKGNLGSFNGYVTDYSRSTMEMSLVDTVFASLPHRVCYKTYPEENRRYPDEDPVFNCVRQAGNMSLYESKVDVRYLIYQHEIMVVGGATSTLGWAMASHKPVIFINWENNMPLTEQAYLDLQQAVFVFNGESSIADGSLKQFLSQPLSDIQSQWQERAKARKWVFEKYFSKYPSGAGKRGGKVIMSLFAKQKG